jgi:phospholipid/cholesterol/gamma-HCH transport system substrate-binding protein
MIQLSRNAIRAIAGVMVAAIVVAAVYFVFLSGGSSKKVTAYFASGVGVYPGTPVKILGIQVGSVTHVKPMGDRVKVDMTYASKYDLPQDAGAYLFANSLVSDRYIQLAPVYNGGAQLASGGAIPLQRTSSPAELDDIYSALNQLSVALGPQGANKNGALSDLIKTSADNLNGNGQAFADSIQNLSAAAQTLSGGSGDLFSTVTNLKNFALALNQSDKNVTDFNHVLAQVSSDLANERADLGSALHNLAVSLHDLANFIHTNANAFHQDLDGLKIFTNQLVKEQASLNEILVVAPVALSNLAHGYQESTGTLGTRSNIVNLTDPTLFPKQICDALYAAGDNPLTSGLLGNLLSQISGVCRTLVTPAASPLAQNLVGGGGQ